MSGIVSKTTIIAITAIVILTVFVLSNPNQIAEANPDKNNAPEFETKVFIDKESPKGQVKIVSECSGKFHTFKGGVSWNQEIVEYSILEDTIPLNLDKEKVKQAIQDAFDVWTDAEPNSPTFIPVTGSANTVFFLPLGETNTVAFTQYTYTVATKKIVAFDVGFNSGKPWSTDGSIDAFDVQNVGTHEFGHAYGLQHVKNDKNSNESMYLFTERGETKKQSLCTGDINGIEKLY